MLPRALIDFMKEGRVILFMGAGASFGATHPENLKIPNALELSDLIAKKFLGTDYLGKPLTYVTELAASETDLFTVQEFIARIFQDYQPAEFHKLIPTFVWSSIATTNYDLIVERAYDAVKTRLQKPVVFKKNGERVEDKIKEPNSVFYFKLHGCITDINDKAVPLILNPDQYVSFKKGRGHLFERLIAMAYEYPILFVGQKLADTDLRTMLLELNSLGGAMPRSYICMPEITPEEERFWESKRMTCIKMTFDSLLKELDGEIPKNVRALSTFVKKERHPIISKFKSPSGIEPSQNLLTFLSRDSEYISKEYKSSSIDPKSFYKGYFVDWTPIIDNLDAKRSITDRIMSEVILATEEDKRGSVEFYLIKGHAGSGKTVILRRLAWDAAIEFNRICIALKRASFPEYESILELYRLCKERIFLFIDPINEYLDVTERFIYRARQDRIPLTIIGAERHNEWNSLCEQLDVFLTDVYEVKYLSEKEIGQLVDLLEKHKSLGHLEGTTKTQQIEALAKRAGRQILVALHEATLGKPFEDIVFDEYKSITSPQAQSLYLTVCILHRLGVETRAGLISRVHGISFEKFRESLFKPLEYIVFASKSDILNDFIYRSRHPHIAEIVFERVLINVEERFSEYVKIISSLDVDYDSDREAFKGLTNARQLLTLFKDPQMIRQIYKTASARDEENPMLMQQEAIFEMNSTGGSLERATEILQRAHKKASHKASIAHSLAELSLRKADKTSNLLQKNKLWQESRSMALELIKSGSIYPYPYHTIVKIGLEELNQLFHEGNESLIESKIRDVDKDLSKAIQYFPDDSFILDSDANFNEMISHNPRAIESLRKAFSVNKRNPYIASRLAKMYEYAGEAPKAIDVLKECLEANPSDKGVNYDVAKLLSKFSGANPAEIKHYLRRSFTEGDTNYLAQFWYARFLYLEGDHPGAIKLFKNLSDINIDSRIKNLPRGKITNGGSEPIKFSGFLSGLEFSYGFIKRDRIQDRMFTHYTYNSKSEWKKLRINTRVNFIMAFSYRGPIALNLSPE
ncbi:MAG: SIR2 family protein [Smithella sp.]